ncbi:FliI/YscN family ATPase [Candidatus Laterigemmans baculatus]|uniref:FliI/YscN family ATPase n=1 Tax=Candidatus Laterigemmans baculatus TaxID=2770505 RepID=UPI0013DA1A4B|nr:FliI/YscN family ATPase [Candidatus Laterigemmans baculatus]
MTTSASVSSHRLPTAAALARSMAAGPLARIRGRVAGVAGGSIEVEGLSAAVGALCRVEASGGERYLAKVIGFRGDRPVLAMLDEARGLAAGDGVEVVTDGVTVAVGPSLCGRVIDALGRPLDRLPLPSGLTRTQVDGDAPSSLDRPTIREPLETGVRVIDSMLTCGIGQRLGIFAGSGVGKSSLLGMLARGSSADAIVIALVGERGREVREFMEEALGEEGLRRSVLVVATSDQPATMRLQAAWTATAVAESLRDQGKHVMLLIDSVTRFAMAQRELGLAAGEPPTTRGYPPSVFAMMPRLVERAGRTERGAITAFYSVLVEGDDTNEPIADTLRGLLDGHIVLSRRLAGQSHWPAIDLLESLSRLQPQLVSPEHRQAATTIRRWIAEYEKHADLIAIGAYRSGSNAELDKAIAMRGAIREFLTQQAEQRHPAKLTGQLLLRLAAGNTDGIA